MSPKEEANKGNRKSVGSLAMSQQRKKGQPVPIPKKKLPAAPKAKAPNASNSLQTGTKKGLPKRGNNPKAAVSVKGKAAALSNDAEDAAAVDADVSSVESSQNSDAEAQSFAENFASKTFKALKNEDREIEPKEAIENLVSVRKNLKKTVPSIIAHSGINHDGEIPLSLTTNENRSWVALAEQDSDRLVKSPASSTFMVSSRSTIEENKTSSKFDSAFSMTSCDLSDGKCCDDNKSGHFSGNFFKNKKLCSMNMSSSSNTKKLIEKFENSFSAGTRGFVDYPGIVKEFGGGNAGVKRRARGKASEGPYKKNIVEVFLEQIEKQKRVIQTARGSRSPCAAFLPKEIYFNLSFDEGSEFNDPSSESSSFRSNNSHYYPRCCCTTDRESQPRDELPIVLHDASLQYTDISDSASQISTNRLNFLLPPYSLYPTKIPIAEDFVCKIFPNPDTKFKISKPTHLEGMSGVSVSKLVKGYLAQVNNANKVNDKPRNRPIRAKGNHYYHSFSPSREQLLETLSKKLNFSKLLELGCKQKIAGGPIWTTSKCY